MYNLKTYNKNPSEISFEEISRISQTSQNIDNLSLVTIKKVFAFSDDLNKIILDGLEVRKVPGGLENKAGIYQLELLSKEGFVINDTELAMLSSAFFVVPNYKVSSYSTIQINDKQISDSSINTINDIPENINESKFNIIKNIFNFGTSDPDDVMKDLQINKTKELGVNHYSLTLTAKKVFLLMVKMNTSQKFFFHKN